MITRLIPLLIFILLAYTSSAQEVSPDGVFHFGKGEIDWGYAQGRKVGNTLYVSGTVSRGATMEEQVKGIYERITKTLEAYGLTSSDVVREVLYTKDIEAMKTSNAPRMAFYDGNKPAATWVQIERLFSPTALVEIEVEARFDVPH